MHPMSFADLLAADPGLPAFRLDHHSATRAELLLASRRAATRLDALGLRRGDAVALWLPDGGIWLQLLFAAARLGLLVVPISTRMREAEARSLVEISRAKLLFVPKVFLGYDYPRAASAIRAAEPALGTVVEVDVERRFLWDDAEPCDGGDGGPDDPLCTFSTSGTTGRPKLAVHAQAGIRTHACNVAAFAGMRAGDATLCTLPLAGVFGFVQALASIAGGATCVFLPVFDPQAAAFAIEQHGVTHFYGSDTMFAPVLAVKDVSLASWRHGGLADFGGLSRQVVEQAEAAWGVRLAGLYGMSECFALISFGDVNAPIDARCAAGGVPIDPAIGFRIADPDTGALRAPGEHGELQLRGYNVMRGYLGNDEASAAAFTDDGWLRTGDLAVAEGGGFRFLARLRDTLRLSGYLVDPSEIEATLCAHPAVAAAQVVGAWREGVGDVAVAFAVCRAPVDEASLLEHCRASVANYKVPKRIVFVDDFPRGQGPNGAKILKTALREMAAARLADPA
ncbi:MAG: AMP-binding protein [Lautropia sp.]